MVGVDALSYGILRGYRGILGRCAKHPQLQFPVLLKAPIPSTLAPDIQSPTRTCALAATCNTQGAFVAWGDEMRSDARDNVLSPDVARGHMAARIIEFISRRTQLRLREMRRIANRVNRFGQYVRPTVAEAEQIQQELLEQRRQDRAWSRRHGRTDQCAVVVPFRNRPVVELTPFDLAEGREELMK